MRSVAEKLRISYAALYAPLGIFVVDAFFHHQAAMHTDADALQRAEKTIPSVFVAPEVSDDLLGSPSHTMDVAIAAGTAAGSVALAKLTKMSSKDMLLTGLAAQGMATVTDGVAVHSGLMSSAEKAGFDDGSSAIEVAYGTRFMFDLISRTENPIAKKTLKASAVLIAMAVTFGASYLDRKNFVTDFSSHASGLGAGWLSHSFNQRVDKASGNDAAAEAFSA